MWVRVCLSTVLILGFAATGVAQLVNETQFFPVVAHTAGAGDPPTSWRSDVTVHYQFLDQNNTVVASGSKDLDFMDMNQWSFRKLGVPMVVDGPCPL